jgi:ribosomal protein S18 acetylase RimI-like enzyme
MQGISVRKPAIEDKYNLIKLLIPEFEIRTNQSLDEGEYFQKWLVNFELMFNSDLVRMFVAANADNQLIGVITAYLLPRLELAGYYSVIEDVYVKESERGKGVGTLIFNQVIEMLKAEKVKYVTLNVAADNIKGQEFYKRLGFSTEALEMRLTLAT